MNSSQATNSPPVTILTFMAALVAILVTVLDRLKHGVEAVLRINSYRIVHKEIMVLDGVLMGETRILLLTLLSIEIALIIAVLGSLIALVGVALVHSEKKD